MDCLITLNCFVEDTLKVPLLAIMMDINKQYHRNPTGNRASFSLDKSTKIPLPSIVQKLNLINTCVYSRIYQSLLRDSKLFYHYASLPLSIDTSSIVFIGAISNSIGFSNVPPQLMKLNCSLTLWMVFLKKLWFRRI